MSDARLNVSVPPLLYAVISETGALSVAEAYTFQVPESGWLLVKANVAVDAVPPFLSKKAEDTAGMADIHLYSVTSVKPPEPLPAIPHPPVV